MIDANNPEEYYKTVKHIFYLIQEEMDRSLVNQEFLPQIYPKLVVMYQFFRLLRGEAFTDIRPPTPQYQKEFYEMENTLKENLELIKSKLPDDDRTRTYIEEMKKNFNLK